MTDYSVLILVFIAKSGGQQTSQSIAANTRLTRPTVSKLVKRLAQAGILTSERGVNGGYALSRSSENISVADVVAAIEERQGLTTCVSAQEHCHLQVHCALSGHWPLVDAAIHQALDQISILALTQPPARLAKQLSMTDNIRSREVTK